MSGVSYKTPAELFADLPGTYLYAVQVPGENVWWAQKDLTEKVGSPLPRNVDAGRHWAWLRMTFPGIQRVKRPGKA